MTADEGGLAREQPDLLPASDNGVRVSARVIGHLAYASALRAEANPIQLAAEHRGTEELNRTLGVPFTFLRHGWYLENYTGQLPT